MNDLERYQPIKTSILVVADTDPNQSTVIDTGNVISMAVRFSARRQKVDVYTAEQPSGPWWPTRTIGHERVYLDADPNQTHAMPSDIIDSFRFIKFVARQWKDRRVTLHINGDRQ